MSQSQRVGSSSRNQLPRPASLSKQSQFYGKDLRERLVPAHIIVSFKCSPICLGTAPRKNCFHRAGECVKEEIKLEKGEIKKPCNCWFQEMVWLFNAYFCF